MIISSVSQLVGNSILSLASADKEYKSFEIQTLPFDVCSLLPFSLNLNQVYRLNRVLLLGFLIGVASPQDALQLKSCLWEILRWSLMEGVRTWPKGIRQTWPEGVRRRG